MDFTMFSEYPIFIGAVKNHFLPDFGEIDVGAAQAHAAAIEKEV
jgi:hypothetical protein